MKERRAEIRIAAAFVVSTAGAIALAIVYGRGGQTQLEGLFLGGSLVALAFGLVSWANHLMPQGPFEGPRPAWGWGEAPPPRAPGAPAGPPPPRPARRRGRTARRGARLRGGGRPAPPQAAGAHARLGGRRPRGGGPVPHPLARAQPGQRP